MDIAIRRRFAFIEMWPDLQVVQQEGIDFATQLFADTIHTFVEFSDGDTLRLYPATHIFSIRDQTSILPGEPTALRGGCGSSYCPCFDTTWMRSSVPEQARLSPGSRIGLKRGLWSIDAKGPD